MRNDETGLWDFSDLDDPLPAELDKKRKAEFIKLEAVKHPAAADIIKSFVRVTCTMPLKLDGFPRPKKMGFGLVFDAEKGLVIISRCIVPYDLCDLSLTIAESIIVEAKIRFLHPLANYAVIQYDPALVDAPVQSAKLARESIKQGASTIFVGWNQNYRIATTPTTITDITPVAIPQNISAPRYRAINLDAITVDTNLSQTCASGVLVAEDGTVQALWMSYLGERTAHTSKDVEYHLGLATPTLFPVLDQIRKDVYPSLRILNIETSIVSLSQARIMGVAEHWISKVAEVNPTRHQLFMIRKVDCAPSTGEDTQLLQEGDVILTLNGQLITRITELDVMYDNEFLDALIVREGKEKTLKIPTIPTQDLETDRAVIFCGAILHRPHHAVRQQISKLHSEVYISGRSRGSPSYQYGLATTNFITGVNDSPTPTLTEFLAVVNKIPNNTYFRLRVCTFDNVPWVATMKKDEHYFPTMEYVKDASEPNGWKVRTFGEQGGVQDLSGAVVDEGPGAVENAGGECGFIRAKL